MIIVAQEWNWYSFYYAFKDESKILIIHSFIQKLLMPQVILLPHKLILPL